MAFVKGDFQKVRPHQESLVRVKVAAQHTIGLADKLGLI
jgi:hypothetical protein